MAELELHAGDGTTERRELSRTQPLSIGRQSINDITVPDEGVASMHCRIAWNKEGYELSSAVKDGVDVNGKLVQHAVLKSGDVIRVGSLDLKFRDSSALREEKSKEPAKEKESGKRRAEKAEKPSKPEKVREPAQRDESSLFEGPVIAESLAEMLADEDSTHANHSEEYSNLMQSRSLSQGDALPQPGESTRGGTPGVIPNELKRNVTAALRANRVRPGEQEIFQSPLVLGLGGGGLLILLVTATVWFLMGRQVALRHYDRGVAELGDSRYAQAIETFESFIKTYPGHSLNAEARIGVGKAKIQRELSGATPSWKRGMEQLEEFLETHRSDPDFKELQPAISQFAETIASGAVKSAEQLKDPELLTTVADATRRLEQFSDPQNPPTAALEQIRAGIELANAAIRKQKTIEAAFVAIEQAFQQQQPIVVLRERAKLLQTYPDLSTLKRVRDALQKAVELEKSIVTVTDTDQPAVTTETPIDSARVVIPIEHTRSRTDEAASGRLVYAVAQDALYAIDTVTGEVVWRQLVGQPAAFFPVLTAGAQPGLLIGETSPPGLSLRHAETGALLWRQSLPALGRGGPLVHDGEIFIAGGERKLYRLDLDTGRLKEQATFSQEIVGPPMVAPDGQHLLIAGDAALIYSLSIRPLQVAAVTFTDHAAGAVTIPLIPMGRLALLCDNDRLESCRLRVWQTEQPMDTLIEANSARVTGQVLDRPVLRGAQLVVVATGERLHAFTVSDDPEKKGLSAISGYQVQGGYAGPMQLALGPDQQFWLASSAFRRFQVTNDSIRADPNSTAPGIASQPLQIIGEQFFVGRHPAYSSAVVFTQVDRERMAGSWRTVLGGRLLAWTEARTGGLIGVSDAGTVFLLNSARLQQGGMERRSGVSLEVPAEVTQPIGATRLADGRLAVWCGDPQPKLWLINVVGQIESEHKLDARLEAAPILMGSSLILPQPGRLKWFASARESSRVQDFVAAVAEGDLPRWEFLVPLDDQGFLACDSAGRLLRLQVRQDDVVHLAEAAQYQLPQPVDVPPSSHQGDLWIADAAGTVRRLDNRSFDVKAERTFAQPVVGLWGDAEATYVQEQDGTLHAMTGEKELPDRWTAALGTQRLLSAPVRIGDKLLWLTRQGAVLELEAATGKEISRTQGPQPFSLGPVMSAGSWSAAAHDGTIYRLAIPSEGQP